MSNKRMDAIRSILTSSPAPTENMLSADNKPAPSPRVSSGSVRAMKETFSNAERENDDLRAKLAAAVVVQEIDPSLIDPSPIADRFREDGDAGFENLKASISQRGQEVPVLLRRHPSIDGRYQSAYGHRRIRAARELGIPVRAVVRTLSDEDLVVAQGLENSARQDLSFIERAVFAARLEEAGHERIVVQDALSVDRAEVSKLVSVAKALPADIIEAIGRAPKIGRPRWQTLADALGTPAALKAVRAAIKADSFSEKDTDARFVAVLSAATEQPKKATDGARVITASGRKVAKVAQSGRGLKIDIDKGFDADFASFLVDQLPILAEAYAKAREEGTS
ncbi:plasmid partitioning protein RepB (plasmid) [Microvirga terrae]|uniref:Plasmid partitioning protein RepB n=1 Tax=Microvirga terrae TaxID=2740529 RepID=A0ABY5S004_9HYPH|nr:plasmid partitioning protein RepB [Microvirga terrae]UVF22811.1 plasmid partitioning protein RepB [Microvirga terrae]